MKPRRCSCKVCSYCYSRDQYEAHRERWVRKKSLRAVRAREQREELNRTISTFLSGALSTDDFLRSLDEFLALGVAADEE